MLSLVTKNCGALDIEPEHNATEMETSLESEVGRANVGGLGNELAVKLLRLLSENRSA